MGSVLNGRPRRPLPEGDYPRMSVQLYAGFDAALRDAAKGLGIRPQVLLAESAMEGINIAIKKRIRQRKRRERAAAQYQAEKAAKKSGVPASVPAAGAPAISLPVRDPGVAPPVPPDPALRRLDEVVAGLQGSSVERAQRYLKFRTVSVGGEYVKDPAALVDAKTVKL